MVVVAGPNGSGKTTLTRLVLKHEWTAGHSYINADEIAQAEFGDWNSLEAVQNAARLADRRREECLTHGRNFAYETVFSTQRHLDLIRRAKRAGWFIRLYFVGTSDPEINIRRIAERVAQGGHDVPSNKVRERYVRSILNLQDALRLVDRGYVFDNSLDHQLWKRWVRTRDGEIVKALDGPMPDWIEEAVTAPEPERGTDLAP
ncbi:MAG: zeta toxin family protein [Hyphomicrobiaceae bacterium]|jgi:predicted ABC-type ATPase